MKRSFFSLVFILVFAFSAFAQIPTGYYTNAEGKTGAELKTALYNIISTHTDVGYDGLYNVYKTSDNLPSGKVWDMYSIKTDGNANYFYSHTSGDQCGSYSSEGDCYNREHTFCDSWLGKASPQRSDAHHILPTDGYVNNRRSSFPHGKVGSVSWTSSNGSKLGSSDPSTGYSGTVFEPIDEFKGDFARMYFYVVTCYENKVAGWASNGSAGELLDGTKYPALKTWFKTLMLQWNAQDPVSQKEIDRNNAIYALQHNRNPFIDHSEYAEAIWGSATVALNFTSTAVTSATVNQPYSYSVSVTGPTGSTFTISAPTIPNWLTLTPTGSKTATLSGTPTSTGSFDVILSVTDETTTKTQSFTIVVAAAEGLKFTSTPITTATVGSPYSYSVTTSNNTNPSATVTISAVTKPTWLNISSTVNGIATLSGTPTANATENITLSASDGTTTVTQSFTLTVSAVSATNTETFTNAPDIKDAYNNTSWTGDDGSTWSATSARTDQTITTGNKAICLKGTSGTYVQSGTLAGGCGSITIKTLQAFTGSGGTLTLYINGNQIGSPFSYTTTQQTATFSNINVSGSFVIKIVNNGSTRPIIDDVTWTGYTGINTPPSISSIDRLPVNPTTTDDVVVSANITDDGTIKEVTLNWGLSASTLDHILTMTLNGGVYSATIPKQAVGTVYIKVNAKDNLDAVSSSTYSYDVIQNAKPTISDISNLPSNPLTGETIKVTATISDSDGSIEDSWIKWGTASSSLTNQVTMVLVDDKYEATLPSWSQAGTIYLSINARDDQGAEVLALHSFVITAPNVFPSISNISINPASPSTGQTVTVSATITDSDGTIQEAYLNWGISLSNQPNKVTLTPSNGCFEGVIPSQSQAGTIYYSIIAKDNLGGESIKQSNFSVSPTTHDGYDENSSEIKVYPNPAQNQIYVEAMGVTTKWIEISNIIGEKVISLSFNGSKQPIDISKLKSGIYFVVVIGDGYRNTTRIVIY